MSDNRYTLESTLGEILEEQEVLSIFNQMMPGKSETKAMSFMRPMTLKQLIDGSPGDRGKYFEILLDAANGLKVDFTPPDSKSELPVVALKGEITYDIDDIDGMLFMLERSFSGSVVVSFTKEMNESVYGFVTCDGKDLPIGTLKKIELTGMQMLGIPVRSVIKEYDAEYTLTVKDFVDTDGNMMEPQNIKVKTLPKRMPDEKYSENDNVALEAAREGIVLLKNEDNILPLNKDATLCITGEESFRLGAAGAGRINPRYSIGFLRGIEEYSGFRLDKNSDTGIIVISRASSENRDNNALPGEYYLTSEEEKCISEMSGKFDKMIAVINSGYPMDMRWTDKYKIQAVVWCGFPGMLGGRAICEILDGRVNPSGKLPDTWSLDYFDIPASSNFYRAKDADSALTTDCPYFVDTVYEEDIYVGYRYFETFEKEVAYPFGFGLSYTQFEIKADCEGMKVKGSILNKGNFAGKETVQIYVKIPDGKLEQPSKRLIGFFKSKLLEPGESQEFVIEISKIDLASFDTHIAAWIIEKGLFEFFAGNCVNAVIKCGEYVAEEFTIVRQSENLMVPPVEIDVLSKLDSEFPKGLKSGVRENITCLTPKSVRKNYIEPHVEPDDFVTKLSIEELARLSVCASHGWGMHGKGEAGRMYKIDKYEMPTFTVADGNNGVNIRKPNIGMPCSNTVCATWNRDLAYDVGRVIAVEAKENDIQMILAPAMNIHRNPLNGRHPEYYSEDPYLAGIMAGHQSKGLEENGVSSCIKHTVANNCETSRKRNHSLLSERALREIYLKAFEVAIGVHKPDSMMTAYNAVNGVFTGEDEEMIQGIFRNEFGFEGFVMMDWGSYDTADVAASLQAGNSWMTPGSTDNTYVTPIVEGVQKGTIDLGRLRSNVRYMLRIVQKRTGKDLGVK